MLSFTRKTDYALISLTHMAAKGTSCCSAREIATRYHMPMPLLMNILKVLTQQGLAASERGPRGGYRLAKPAEQITLHDIILAVDGPVSLVQCVKPMDERRPPASVGSEGTPGGSKESSFTTQEGEQPKDCGCELSAWCPVRTSTHKVHHKLVQMLKDVTLAEIIENSGKGEVSPVPNTAIWGDSIQHEAAHLS